MDAMALYERAERNLLERHGLTARSRYIDLEVPRTRVRLLEIGDGEPVFFVHGGGGAAMNWIPLVAHLPGIRALLVDRPGHGLSDAFDYGGVRVRDHAVSCISSVLDASGIERAQVVANSMGATWTLWTAIDAPQRVTSLALLGCPAFILDTSAPAAMRLLSVPYLGRLLLKLQPADERGARQMWTLVRADLDALSPEFIDATAALLRVPSIGLGYRTLLENMLRIVGPQPYAISADDLVRVRQPTLFVWGTRDPFGGAAVGRRAASLMPDARIEVVPEGHLPWLDDPGRTARLVAEHLGIRERAVTRAASGSVS